MADKEIGERLKEAREKKGLSLYEAEDSTKIRSKYLQAIENNNFSELPGRVYVIGFLRNYARFLGLDAEELVEEYKKIAPAEKEYEIETQSDYTPKRLAFNLKVPIIIIAILAGIIISWYFLAEGKVEESQKPLEGINSGDLNNPDSGSGSQATTGDNIGHSENGASEDETSDGEDNGSKNSAEHLEGLRVTIDVVKQECWISVTEEGRVVFSGTLKAGERKTFTGTDKITIKFGNAGAVRVTHNGLRLEPLGKDGEIVTREFKASP